MPVQKLSVKFPEPIQFPEGVDTENLLLHLIAWYFYSVGKSESALKLTGESLLEVEKKLLDFGFSNRGINRVNTEKILKRVDAMKIVQDAETLSEQRVKQGWTDHDFKQDFLKVQEEITKSLKK